MPNYGIAQGLERGTSNIMNIMMQKKKIDQQKEQNKIINKYRTAQTDMLDMELKQKAKTSKRQEFMFNKIKSQYDAYNKGLGEGQGQGQTEQGYGYGGGGEGTNLNLPMGGRSVPSGGNTRMSPQDMDWKMDSSGEMSFQSKGREKRYKEDIMNRYQFDPKSVSDEEKKLAGLYIKPEKAEKMTESKRKFIGEIKMYMDNGAPAGELREAIRHEGYDEADFAALLEGYDPEEKKSIMQKIFGAVSKGNELSKKFFGNKN